MILPKKSVFDRPFPQVSDTQMAALELLIVNSEHANELAKQVAIWMIRQSDNLASHVRFSVPKIPGAEIWDGIHGMNSHDATTRLPLVLAAMGTCLMLDGEYNDLAQCYMFELAPRNYPGEKPAAVKVDLGEAMAINLDEVLVGL